jgi:hypothetical protein
MSAELSEEQIRSMLLDNTARAITRYCIEPHTSAEIAKMIASPYEPQAYQETLVGQTLRNLEQSGAMTFSSGKWKTNDEVIVILQKYFGGP